MIGFKGSCVAVLAVCFFSTVQGGMDCPHFFKAEQSSKNFIDSARDAVTDLLQPNHCPRFDEKDAFCCYDTKGVAYCCDFPSFAIFVAILLVCLLALSSIISCICCLCCPCCFCYKRRQGGGSFV